MLAYHLGWFGGKDGSDSRVPPIELLPNSRIWEIRSYAAVSRLPKLPAFNEDYMTLMFDSLTPADQERCGSIGSY
jgi:hypothetical protein